MVEVGYVTALKGDCALISFKRKSGWGDNCASCGAGCAPSSAVVDVKNILNASVGDEVQVTLETKSFMKMTLWAYGFPLIMLLVGILLGNYYFKNLGFGNYELLSFVVGIILLVVSYTILGKIDKKASKNGKYDLKMVKIIK